MNQLIFHKKLIVCLWINNHFNYISMWTLHHVVLAAGSCFLFDPFCYRFTHDLRGPSPSARLLAHVLSSPADVSNVIMITSPAPASPRPQSDHIIIIMSNWRSPAPSNHSSVFVHNGVNMNHIFPLSSSIVAADGPIRAKYCPSLALLSSVHDARIVNIVMATFWRRIAAHCYLVWSRSLSKIRVSELWATKLVGTRSPRQAASAPPRHFFVETSHLGDDITLNGSSN